MDRGFEFFKVLSEEARRMLNAKRTELKTAERKAWQEGRDKALGKSKVTA